MINSREKGARGERMLAKALRSHGKEARRGQQFSGGSDSPDVICNMPFVHWEMKFKERFNLYEAYAQATRDADEYHIPVVAHKKKYKPIMVILSLDDFMKFRLKMEYLLGTKKVNPK